MDLSAIPASIDTELYPCANLMYTRETQHPECLGFLIGIRTVLVCAPISLHQSSIEARRFYILD